jgi:hypothetical protein
MSVSTEVRSGSQAKLLTEFRAASAPVLEGNALEEAKKQWATVLLIRIWGSRQNGIILCNFVFFSHAMAKALQITPFFRATLVKCYEIFRQ